MCVIVYSKIFISEDYSMVDISNNKNLSPNSDLSIEAKLEALLFVTPTTATLTQLADALETTTHQVEKALTNLSEILESRGIRLQEYKGRFLLTSAPEISEVVEKYLQLEYTSRFSAAALETLAIIAYQQPITRPSVDSIRGVNSDSVIKNLLSKGLIEETGRSDGPGRPILYSTSPEFLQSFGLASLRDLPPIDISKKIQSASEEATQQQLPLDTQLLKE